jgi:hypothetical protein
MVVFEVGTSDPGAIRRPRREPRTMDARQARDALLLSAGAVTAAGLVAGAPLVSVIAASIAAITTASSRQPSAVPEGGETAPRSLRDLAESPVMRAYSDHGPEDRNGAGPSEPSEQSDDPSADEAAEDGRMIEDLAASLETDDDEISFLPPYASGDQSESTREDGLAVLWKPTPDNDLLRLLNDVLEPSGNVPMPRRFALGTVAILRNLLQPADVARILEEQRRYPRLRFGDIAVQLGFLTDDELAELLAAQQEGLFTDEEILDTRARLNAYHLETERRESA